MVVSKLILVKIKIGNEYEIEGVFLQVYDSVVFCKKGYSTC